jgi:hypothetical protein
MTKQVGTSPAASGPRGPAGGLVRSIALSDRDRRPSPPPLPWGGWTGRLSSCGMDPDEVLSAMGGHRSTGSSTENVLPAPSADVTVITPPAESAPAYDRSTAKRGGSGEGAP